MSTIQFICPSAVDSIIFKSVPIANLGEIKSYGDSTGYTNAFDTVHPSKQNCYILYYIHFQLQQLLKIIPQRRATALRINGREKKALVLSLPSPTFTEQRFFNLSAH